MHNEYKYLAFISYNHKDEEQVKEIHKWLEGYHLPINLRREKPDLPSNIRPIFLDKEELSSGVLTEEIKRSLRESKFLLVVCSPNSAQSKWVDEEVRYFIELGREKQIIPFIIAGKPFSGNQETECYSSSLQSLSGERELLGITAIGVETKKKAKLKVVAQMLGVRFDSLWQRWERAERRKRNIICLSIFILLITAIVAVAFYYYQNIQIKINRGRTVAYTSQRLLDNKEYIMAQMLCLEVSPQKGYPYITEVERMLRASVDSMKYSTINSIIYNCDNYEDVFLSPNGKYVANVSNGQIRNLKTGKISYVGDQSGKILSFVSDSTCYVRMGVSVSLWNFVQKNELFEPKTFNYGSSLTPIEDIYPDDWDTKMNKDGFEYIPHDWSGLKFNIKSDKCSFCLYDLEKNSHTIGVCLYDTKTNLIDTIRCHFDKTKWINDSLFSIYSSGNKQIIIRNVNKKQNIVIPTLSEVFDWGLDDKGTNLAVSYSGCNGVLYFYDVLKGGMANIINVSSSLITSFSFSKNGEILAIGDNEGNISIFEVAGLKKIKTFKWHLKKINDLDFSINGKLLISKSDDGTAVVWNLDNERLRFDSDKKIGLVTFSHDDKYIITSCHDSNTVGVYVYDTLKKGKKELLVDFIGNKYIKTIAVSNDNKYIVYAVDPDNISIAGSKGYLWNLETEEYQEIEGGYSYTFTPDNRYLISLRKNNLSLLDLKTGCEQIIDEVDYTNPSSFLIDDNRVKIITPFHDENLEFVEDNDYNRFQLVAFNDKHIENVIKSVNIEQSDIPIKWNNKYNVKQSIFNNNTYVSIIDTKFKQILYSLTKQGITYVALSNSGDKIAVSYNDLDNSSVELIDFPHYDKLLEEVKKSLMSREITDDERKYLNFIMSIN